MTKLEILVIDDEKEMLVSYEKILTRQGFTVHPMQDARAALQFLREDHNISLIICDLKMPVMDGMDLLGEIKKLHPYLPVIMVTGYGTLELAIEAVKNGAFDFIEKPFSSKKLLTSIQNALNQIAPSPKSPTEDTFDNIVGKSQAMKDVFEMIQKVSYGNANILITGESGTGKELVARSIHKHSLRRNQPIIPINCGALPENLFESELFGYEKGAFTGAFQAKPGLVELANGGTLFLDEVCELPLQLQVKLLRTLEDRTIRRIGGKEEIPVDIRVVSATNRDPEQSIREGILREDFFYRINTIRIHIPPLRERKEDIELLITHFLHELDRRYKRNITAIDPAALEALYAYNWPGNVRELQNVIERTYYLASPPLIRLHDLPSQISDCVTVSSEASWKHLPYREAKEKALENFEKKYLLFHLEQNHWNISRTAEKCGIDRRTIHRLIKRYKLKEPGPQ